MTNNSTTPVSLDALAVGRSSTNAFITIFDTRNPISNDVNYPVQQRWFNLNTDAEFILTGYSIVNEIKMATWQEITASGSGVESFVVDTFTPPGTNPVTPNGSSEVIVTGGQVSAGTTANVIQTNSLAANTYTIQVQRSQSVASSTIGDNGVCHFDSADFDVDANGFVTFVGDGSSITLTGNDSIPVAPTLGNINVVGAGSITTVGTPLTSTLTVELTGLTSHNVLVGSGTPTITKVPPSTAGFVLTSNGAAVDPSFQNVSASGAIIEIDGDTGSMTPTAGVVTISGGTTGLTTTASGSLMNLTGTLNIGHGGTNATSFGTTHGVVVYDGTRLVNYAGPQISTAGVYTNTTQPAFLAYLSGRVLNATGDGTIYTVICDQVKYDQDSNYNAGTGTFTAPVTGKYQFSYGIRISEILSMFTTYFIALNTTSARWRGTQSNTIFDFGDMFASSSSITVNMTAGDTAVIQVQVDGGAKTIDIDGGSGTDNSTWFSGVLLD